MRYDSIKFEKFAIDDLNFQGEKYKTSFGLIVDPISGHKMSSVNNLDSVDISTGAAFRRLFLSLASDVLGLEVTYDNCFIIPVCILNAGNYNLRIYKVTGAGVVSLIATPVVNWGGGDLYFYKIKDTIYLSDDDTVYKRSTNGGVTWSDFSGSVWYGPHLYREGYYYTPDGRKRTQDALIWENYISITEYPFKVSRFVFYRGFFYGLAYERSNSYVLSLIKFNNDLTWERVETFNNSLGSLSAIHSNMEIFDDKIIIGFYGKFLKVYSFDGNKCKLLKEFDGLVPVDGVNITRIRLKVVDENNLAILVSADVNYIYRDLIIYNGKDFFHVNKGTATNIFLDVGKIGDTFMILVDRQYDGAMTDPTNYALLHNYNKKFFTAGYAETEIIDKGEIVPKQVILRHNPLPANVSIALYARKNKTTSWGSALATFTTASSVKNVYSFLKSYGAVDYLELKIILLTSNNVSTAKEITLELLYLPVGLTKSK